jgi:hypothetical protein
MSANTLQTNCNLKGNQTMTKEDRIRTDDIPGQAFDALALANGLPVRLLMLTAKGAKHGG